MHLLKLRVKENKSRTRLQCAPRTMTPQGGSEVRARGILLCESEAVVHEPTLASRIDRVAVDKLLLTQRRQVATLFVQPVASCSARRHTGPAPPPLPAFLRCLDDLQEILHTHLQQLICRFTGGKRRQCRKRVLHLGTEQQAGGGGCLTRAEDPAQSLSRLQQPAWTFGRQQREAAHRASSLQCRPDVVVNEVVVVLFL